MNLNYNDNNNNNDGNDKDSMNSNNNITNYEDGDAFDGQRFEGNTEHGITLCILCSFQKCLFFCLSFCLFHVSKTRGANDVIVTFCCASLNLPFILFFIYFFHALWCKSRCFLLYLFLDTIYLAFFFAIQLTLYTLCSSPFLDYQHNRY